MADEYKRFSAKKIAKGFVKSNINFWGGDTAPYLNRMFDTVTDLDSFFTQYKIPVSDSGKIKRAQKDMQRYLNEYNELEKVVIDLRSSYILAINTLDQITNQLDIIVITSNVDIFSSSIAFNINKKLLGSLLITSVNPKYYAIYSGARTNRTVPNLKDYIKSYEMAIKTAKELERKTLVEIANLNNITRNYKNAKNVYTSTITQFKRNK